MAPRRRRVSRGRYPQRPRAARADADASRRPLGSLVATTSFAPSPERAAVRTRVAPYLTPPSVTEERFPFQGPPVFSWLTEWVPTRKASGA